jgi:hypothetical protein
MRKISIITLLSVLNYGSVLQAFATQKIFEEYGYNPEFINYRRTDAKNVFARIDRWVRGWPLVNRVLGAIVLFPSLMKQDCIFSCFLKKYINVNPVICCCENDFSKLPLDAEIYCTGSDQVWNSDWNEGIIPPLFLSFAPDNITKIAYSASFGKQYLDDWEKEETRRLLHRYDAISVRESNGVKIINDLTLDNVSHVLDPTLQMGKSFWKQYIGKRLVKKRYMLIYQLNTNESFDRYAKEFASKKGLKLVRLCTRYDQILKSGHSILIPQVFDFLSLIYHADYIITDSFHGTAFCINLNKDFISIIPDKFGSRIESILQLTKLNARQLKSYTDYSLLDAPPINYTVVNEILQKEREKGHSFLMKALNIQL